MKTNSTIIILLSLFALISCTQGNKNESKSNKLTIGVMSSMDYLPIAVAKQRGYFDEYNLEVDIQKFYSPNERDAALQSKSLDGTILDYTGGAIQVSGGVPLKFTSQCDGTFEVIVSNGSNINSINDLKGKTIAISRNTVIDYCTDLVISQAGMTSQDVDIVEINKIPLRLEMLNNSKIDVTTLPDPFATMAKNEDNKKIISLSDLDVRVTGIAFLQDVIDEKKEALSNLYDAYNKAINDLQNEPASNFKDLLIKEIGFPKGLISNITLPKYTKAQQPQENDLYEVGKWLKKKGLLEQDFEMKSILATGIIN